jgi:hypothetical protein
MGIRRSPMVTAWDIPGMDMVGLMAIRRCSRPPLLRIIQTPHSQAPRRVTILRKHLPGNTPRFGIFVLKAMAITRRSSYVPPDGPKYRRSRKVKRKMPGTYVMPPRVITPMFATATRRGIGSHPQQLTAKNHEGRDVLSFDDTFPFPGVQ